MRGFTVYQFIPRELQPAAWFNIKMLSYQYRKSHCGDKTIVRSSYLHNGISYTGKMSFYIESETSFLILFELGFVRPASNSIWQLLLIFGNNYQVLFGNYTCSSLALIIRFYSAIMPTHPWLINRFYLATIPAHHWLWLSGFLWQLYLLILDSDYQVVFGNYTCLSLTDYQVVFGNYASSSWALIIRFYLATIPAHP